MAWSMGFIPQSGGYKLAPTAILVRGVLGGRGGFFHHRFSGMVFRPLCSEEMSFRVLVPYSSWDL